jgi:flagellar hook protein FlgE
MSLYGAMFSGVSALNAQSQALGMISDNISNVNTIGYKTTSAAFSTLVTRQTTNFYAPGGVRSTPISSIDRQGLLQSSSNATDLAISGSGFFVTAGSSTPTANDARAFTRAGQFTTDQAGYLRTPGGQYLQGWATDSAGVPLTPNTSLVSNLESVRVSGVSGSAVATSSIDLGLNLPASAALPASVANGSIQTTDVQIFDSLGVAHDVALTWTKTAALNWTLTINAPDATVPAGNEDTGAGSTPYSMAVVFNPDGTILNFDGSGTAPSTTPNSMYFSGWTSGASASTLALNLGTAGAIGTAQADGVTQFSSSYSVAFANQNGVQFGNFFGVNVDDKGIVSALYDNGQTLKIYKLPIATFPNPNGLDAKNGTAFSESQASGGYFLRSAGTSNAGDIVASALEASNADIANEFTNMIVTQRAYSAATRTITTADEMLDELIRIKR